MSQMKVTQAGVGLRGDNLVVGLQIDTGTWQRFATVDVPLHLLLHEDVTAALDTIVRRRLNERWTMLGLDDTLPLDGL